MPRSVLAVVVWNCSIGYLLEVVSKEMLGSECLRLERPGALLTTERNLPVASVAARVDARSGARAFDRGVGVVKAAHATVVIGVAAAHVAERVRGMRRWITTVQVDHAVGQAVR